MKKRTAVLLAGGKASRAKGANKAYFLNREKTLLEHFLEEFHEYDCRIAGPMERFTGYEEMVLPDCYEAGPLGAIAGALERIPEEWIFFAACDMPNVTAQMAEILYENREGADGMCFLDETGRMQPLFVWLHRRCLPVLTEQMKHGNWSLQRCFENLNMKKVLAKDYNLPEQCFENWNTPHEERQNIPGGGASILPETTE